MRDSIIKQKREALGFSQSQFARMSGVNFRTLQDYEQGRKPLSSIKGEVLYRISANLGCSMEELLMESVSGAEDEQNLFRRYARLVRYSELMERMLEEKHAGKINTPFDDVFKTLSVDCCSLLVPIINLIFGENYDVSAVVEQRQNEHFSHGNDGDVKKTISDANFIILEKNGKSKSYQVECQSRADNTILVRMFEYATSAALECGRMEGDVLHIEYPKSALVYLRHTANTPDHMKVELDTPGGCLQWKIPVIRSQLYSVDDIFDKHLYMLIPFYFLTYEKRLPAIEKSPEETAALKHTYEEIFRRLEEATERGFLNTYEWTAIRNMCKRICDYMTDNYHKINAEVREVMGGQVLDYEAKRILNQGISQGISKGIVSMVATLQELNIPREIIVQKLQEKFQLSKEGADQYIKS